MPRNLTLARALLMSCMVLFAGSVEAEDSLSYRYGDHPIDLAVDPERAALLLEPDFDSLAALELVLGGLQEFQAPVLEDRQAYEHLWLPRFVEGLSDEQRALAIAQVHGRPGVQFAAPLLHYNEALVIPKPELLVVLDEDGAAETLESLLQSEDLSLEREFAALRPILQLAFTGTPRQSFARCWQLLDHPGVAAANPSFILKLVPPLAPNDPNYAMQWAHDNTGQTGGTVGADIGTPEAWDITTGSASIVLAILDEGVDVDHEDLAANMVAGHDSTNQASPEGVPGNAANNDPHGTACAGIAGAVGDNNLGVAGVNWDVSIMPVRLGYGFHWTETPWTIDAIMWATDNGADVLSNSWGGGPPETPQEDAVIYAATTGRGGLGCAVFFATCNFNGPVCYPAAYDISIAVGATSPCDERKSPSSCDGEGWGSNFGPQVNVVAPGVLCPSTDIMGSGGYTSGNYTEDFGGTSCATPHAAGAAALLLSVSPNLTASEVQQRLEETADDEVGPAFEDTPGFDFYMGWGRINVHSLLKGGGAVFLRGDADLSGLLNIADPIATFQYLFAAAPLACLDAADANDSGSIDIADGIWSLSYQFAEGPPPPEPFPTPGQDPTSDSLNCAQGLP